MAPFLLPGSGRLDKEGLQIPIAFIAFHIGTDKELGPVAPSREGVGGHGQDAVQYSNTHDAGDGPHTAAQAGDLQAGIAVGHPGVDDNLGTS